jgi:beta-adrenergic-receptor kinase
VFSGIDWHLFDELDCIVFYYIKDKYFQSFQTSPSWVKYHQYMFISTRPVGEDDFLLFRVLGRGGFGLVNGCKRAQSGKLFAMKMMNKKRVKMKKADSLCNNERTILAVVDSPFIVCLKYAFATKEELFLILDLMMGGDLGYHLSRKGKFTERESKYYSARIVLGLKALHDDMIVFRDLKPENILMNDDGKTRISDLGLACKVGKSGLSGTCGTRGYWAPEMLRRDEAGKRERYSLSVDWFSLGCCIYEFHYGVSPFRTERARKWGKL